MPELTFILSGANASASADSFAAVLAVDGAAVTRRPAEAVPEAARRAVDPIALTALVLSVPPAMLACADLVQRITKRLKAKAVVEQARQLRQDQHVEVYVLLPDGSPRAMATLDADALLDIAEAVERSARLQ